MIMPHLTKLIDERKNSNKNEQNGQLSIGVNFMCITVKEKSRTFYVNSHNEEIRSANNAINKLIESNHFYLTIKKKNKY